jgi:hypothetical protein
MRLKAQQSKLAGQLFRFISEFPIGNTAITVGLMERLKPGTMLLFCFEVPRDQKQ